MSDADHADRRLGILDHRHGWQVGVLGAGLTVLLSAILLIGTMARINTAGMTTISVDFYVFWAAAKLALAGLPLDVFDVARLQEVAGLVDKNWMPWAYPPGFLMLVAPFGLLPFGPAWAAFNVAGVVALLLATRPFSGGRVQVLLAAALAPAMLPCLVVGQTTVLWAAGLMAALAALRADRPVLAGMFIGCLTLKPQLGLLLPVALVACGAWRAIASATVTTLLLAAIPTIFFGADYWPEMLAMMKLHADTVRGAIGDVPLMVSAYSNFVALGLPEPLALALQWGLTGVCALVVFFVWRRPGAGFDLRAAVLLTAIPLASPYLWFYETALLAPAALFMLRAGVLAPRPVTLLLGLAMWLGLGPLAINLLVGGGIYAPRNVAVLLMLVAFATCSYHAASRIGGRVVPSP